MTTQPTTFNLKMVSEKLRGQEKYAKFRRLVDDLQRLHSIRTDLHHSVESFEAIWNITIEDRELLATVHQALLHNGIVLYSRAVHTASKHRKQVDVRNNFTKEQLLVHEELCSLRNDAIVHFGPGKSYRGEWMRETIALQTFPDESGRIAGLSRRLALDIALLKRAQAQAKTALEIVIQRFHDMNTSLVEQMNNNFTDDIVFGQAISECVMDLSSYLGNDCAADNAIASRVAGHGQGVVEHH